MNARALSFESARFAGALSALSSAVFSEPVAAAFSVFAPPPPELFGAGLYALSALGYGAAFGALGGGCALGAG